MRWVGGSDGGEGAVSAGRSAGRRIDARSPSQERAAANTRPQGGGSLRRARYFIETETRILSRCLHPAQVCNNKAN